EPRARAILEVLSSLGVRAVALGELDLRLGARAIDALARESAIPLLCGNIKDNSGLLSLKGSADVPGARVVAVIDPELAAGDPALVATSPAQCVARELSKRPAGARGVVLFHGTAERAALELANVAG